MNTFIKLYWKAGLCFLGVFLAGGVTGGIITAGCIRQALIRKANPDNWQPMAMRVLTRRLNLRPDQVDKINPMVTATVQDLRMTRAARYVEVSQSLQQCLTNVSTVLDPDQQKRFEKLVEEHRERWNEHFSGK